jgi:hypothetical protein
VLFGQLIALLALVSSVSQPGRPVTDTLEQVSDLLLLARLLTVDAANFKGSGRHPTVCDERLTELPSCCGGSDLPAWICTLPSKKQALTPNNEALGQYEKVPRLGTSGLSY